MPQTFTYISHFMTCRDFGDNMSQLKSLTIMQPFGILFFFSFRPPPELLPVLGPLEW